MPPATCEPSQPLSTGGDAKQMPPVGHDLASRLTHCVVAATFLSPVRREPACRALVETDSSIETHTLIKDCETDGI
jgi:hypothetical protein